MSKPDPACQSCGGSGMIEYVGGEFATPGNTYSGSSTVHATLERPVYRPCPCARRTVKPTPEATSTERFEREHD